MIATSQNCETNEGQRVYLDANTLIYAIELPLLPNLKTGLLMPLDQQEFTAVTSEITLAERSLAPAERATLQTNSYSETFLSRRQTF